MSWQAVEWALGADAPPPAKITLVALATKARPDGTAAWFPQQALADWIGKSVRQIRYDIADLEKRGLLLRGDQRLVASQGHRRKPVVYDLPIGNPLPLSSPKAAIQRRQKRQPIADTPSFNQDPAFSMIEESYVD